MDKINDPQVIVSPLRGTKLGGHYMQLFVKCRKSLRASPSFLGVPKEKKGRVVWLHTAPKGQSGH